MEPETCKNEIVLLDLIERDLTKDIAFVQDATRVSKLVTYSPDFRAKGVLLRSQLRPHVQVCGAHLWVDRDTVNITPQ